MDVERMERSREAYHRIMSGRSKCFRSGRTLRDASERRDAESTTPKNEGHTPAQVVRGGDTLEKGERREKRSEARLLVLASVSSSFREQEKDVVN